MLDKIKQLFNVKLWAEKFIGSQILNKAVKHAVTVIIGLLGSAIFTMKVKPILDQFGLQIDPARLAEGLTILLTGLAGSLLNWAIKVFYHDSETGVTPPPPAN